MDFMIWSTSSSGQSRVDSLATGLPQHIFATIFQKWPATVTSLPRFRATSLPHSLPLVCHTFCATGCAALVLARIKIELMLLYDMSHITWSILFGPIIPYGNVQC